MMHHALFVVASATTLLCSQTVQAGSGADVYAGTTVKIVTGAGTGGGYALYAQLIATHLGKHIPGKPTVIVESMPGAGGLRALNYLANAAPKDGTVLALPLVNIIQEGLLNPKARYDPRAFRWLGRVASVVQVGVVWSKRSNVTTLADARTKELVAGAVAANNPTGINPRLLNALAGTKFKVVTGYPGTNAVRIAWERGEVDMLSTAWDIVRTRYRDQLASKEIVPLYAYAMRRVPGLAQVPVTTELGNTDAERAFLKIYTIGTEIGRSLAAPPGVPKDRVAILRAAFEKMLDDPDFKRAVTKGNMGFEPLGGKALAAAVTEVLNLPAEHVALARKFYEGLLAPTR